MLNEVIGIVGGIVALGAAYYVEKELEEEYYEKDATRLLANRRIFFLVALHALFFPWAYFKPWKVREGYSLLLAEILLFSLGVYAEASVFF